MNEQRDVNAHYNTPPQNLDAEQCVLGAVLCDSTVLARARARAEDFYKDGHRVIWAAMRGMHERGEHIDLITLSATLERDAAEVFQKAGGVGYLSQLVSMVPTAAGFAAHETLVLEAAALRRIIDTARLMMQKGYDLQDSDGIITAGIAALNDVRGRAAGQVVSYSDIITLGFEVIEKNYEHRGTLSGITTGIPGIDKITNGYQPGWFYLLAARPGKGKTALAMLSARAGGKAGKRIGIVSLEMSAEQLALREISSEADVPLSRLLSGYLHDSDWEVLPQAAGALHPLPIKCVFTAFDASEVERAINYLVQVEKCAIIFLDYLQLISYKGHRGTREQMVSDISRMLKRQAKELHVPLVALAQLNRGLENRTDKRPGLADLRESGSLEQDADVVGFLHHEICKCPKEVPCLCGNRHKAWYIQGKGRMNPTGDVPLIWKGSTTTFREGEGESRS